MELSRSDFQILNVLKEHQCTNYQESMTLQEIIPELPFSRVTAYKRLKNLCDMGYTAKGCQAEQADTYYILEKGIRVADIKDITELMLTHIIRMRLVEITRKLKKVRIFLKINHFFNEKWFIRIGRIRDRAVVLVTIPVSTRSSNSGIISVRAL